MKPKIPQHLSKSTKAWWRQIQQAYGVSDPIGLSLLQQAAEAKDRMLSARESLDRDGMTFLDRFGKPKVHPLCAVVRDCEASFRAALKALKLDPDAVTTPRDAFSEFDED